MPERRNRALTGGRRHGRAQDIVGGAGNAIDVSIGHHGTCDHTEKSRRGQPVCRAPEGHAEKAGLYC